MTVQELIELLEKEDPEKEVYVPCFGGDYEFYIVNSVINRDITMYDTEEEKDVIIIDFE